MAFSGSLCAEEQLYQDIFSVWLFCQSWAHTLYVKEKDGTELAQLPIVITMGEETSVNGNNIIAKGNTTIDLSLKNGLTLKNVAETKTASTAGNGVPVWIVAVLVVAAILAGGTASYFLLGDGRFLFARKMEENNDDEEGPFIVM